MAFVVATLPIELWRLVFDHCDRAAAARLGATCAALHAESIDRARRRWDGARSAIDALVDQWQSLTDHWDRYADECEYPCWRDRHTDDGYDDEMDTDAGPPQDFVRCANAARWFCQGQASGRPWGVVTCDSCARTVLDDPANGGGVMHPMDPSRSHVWAVMVIGGPTIHVLWADAVDGRRFRVPPAAIHLADPVAVSDLDGWFDDGDPNVDLGGMSWATMGSLRGWMPLIGARTLLDAAHIVRVPMVCCDADSPAWGAVALVDYVAQCAGPDVDWHVVGDSLEAVLMRHRLARAASPDTDADWVAWAADADIPLERN